MPPAHLKVDLGSVAPTPEEMEAARAILRGASNGQMKSRMASMVHFLKAAEDEKGQKSRGTDRQKYLEAFTVHQLRGKNTQKKMRSIENKTSKQGTFVDYLWWSEEKIIKEMGEVKGMAWITFKKPPLLTRACRLTGSMEDKLKEFRIPIDWERMSIEDIQSMQVEATSDATDADLKLLRDMAPASSGGSADAPLFPADSGAATIKQEKLTPEEQDQKEAKEFKETISVYIREFQECEVRAGEMKSALQTNKYAEAILIDIDKHSAKVTKVLRVLQRLQVTTIPVTPENHHLVIQHMENVRKEHRELNEHAVKFGLQPKPSPKKRRNS